MPDAAPSLSLTLHGSILDIDAAEWDACAGDANPFVSHAFLACIEASGSAGKRHRLAAPPRRPARRSRPAGRRGADVHQGP